MDLVISSMCDFQGEIKKLNDQIQEIKGNLADNITNYSGLKDSLAFSYSHSGQMLGKYTRRRVMFQYPLEKYAKSYSGFVSEGNCFDDEKGIMLLKNGSLLRGKFLGNKHFKRVDD